MHPNQSKTAIAALACAIAATVTATSGVARIIGADDRRPVSHEESQRYGAIGIVAVASGARVYGGTGTLINDQVTVLTAFHNVFHDGSTGPIGQLKAPMHKIHFLVGNRLQDERTYYRIKSIRPLSRDYGLVLPDEDDLAILTLHEPVPGAEPLFLEALDPEEDGQGLGDVTHVSYAGLKKIVQECRFRERFSGMAPYPRSADVLVHDCDSEGNASGSPFLNGSDRIVAVHLGGSPRGPKISGRPFNPRHNFNVARKITAEVQRFVATDD